MYCNIFNCIHSYNIPGLCMTFSLHQGVVKSDKHTNVQRTPLAHILDTGIFIFSTFALFSLTQPHHVTASHPPQVITILFQLHMHLGSPLIQIFCAQPPQSFFCCRRPPSHHPSSLTSIYRLPGLHLLHEHPSGHSFNMPNHLNTL